MHSQYSFDSMTRLNSILSVAWKQQLDFVILTDHGSVEGSRALRKLAEERGLAIEVPIAGEFRTPFGDVIAAFVQRDVTATDWQKFIKDVRKQGGLILLPHPFHDHSQVHLIAREADLIEAYNGRVEPECNERAANLARDLGKPVYFASDAHLARNVGKVIIEIEGQGSLKDALITGSVRPVRLDSVGFGDVLVSQHVKAWKTRDFWAITYSTFRPLYRWLRQKVRRWLPPSRAVHYRRS